MEQTYVDSFGIPEELGKELTDLIVRQSIYETTLSKLMADNQQYDKVLDELASIIEKSEVIKNRITKEFVPEKYRKEIYSWNYNGFHISGTKVDIYKN